MTTPAASGDFAFTPLRETDLPMLMEWHARAHVARWWDPAPGSLDELRADFLSGATGIEAFIVWLKGRPIGFVQVYVVRDAGGGWWPDETDPGARGIDQFLANEEDLGRGMGGAMVRSLLARLFADPAVTKVQTDPAPDNARAIRACEKAGFTRVGVVDTPDGAAMLMVCARGKFEGEGRVPGS